jgi:hypothetical protein
MSTKLRSHKSAEYFIDSISGKYVLARRFCDGILKQYTYEELADLINTGVRINGVKLTNGKLKVKVPSMTSDMLKARGYYSADTLYKRKRIIEIASKTNGVCVVDILSAGYVTLETLGTSKQVQFSTRSVKSLLELGVEVWGISYKSDTNSSVRCKPSYTLTNTIELTDEEGLQRYKVIRSVLDGEILCVFNIDTTPYTRIYDLESFTEMYDTGLLHEVSDRISSTELSTKELLDAYMRVSSKSYHTLMLFNVHQILSRDSIARGYVRTSTSLYDYIFNPKVCKKLTKLRDKELLDVYYRYNVLYNMRYDLSERPDIVDLVNKLSSKTITDNKILAVLSVIRHNNKVTDRQLRVLTKYAKKLKIPV